MKIRNGFVSNSSSSSFVIAVKGDLEKQIDKLTESVIKDIKNSPLDFSNMIKGMMNSFIHTSEKIDDINCEEFEYDYGWTEEDFAERYPEIYDKIKNEGWNLYLGAVHDEDVEPEEMMLVAAAIDYKDDDNLIIKKDAWY
jgi:hypothetical protein